jgi:hypothetical protein
MAAAVRLSRQERQRAIAEAAMRELAIEREEAALCVRW